MLGITLGINSGYDLLGMIVMVGVGYYFLKFALIVLGGDGSNDDPWTL